MHRYRFLGVVGLLAVASGAMLCAGGCGSSLDGPTAECNSNPFQCGVGTTCSVKSCTCTTSDCTDSNCTPAFACLPSDANGVQGGSCSNKLGAASCDDGLACVAQAGQGVCTAYCNTSQPCSPGLVCAPKTVEIGTAASYPVIYVCQLPDDGGLLELDSGLGASCDADLETGPVLDGTRFDVMFVDVGPPPLDGSLRR
jgi:hypothetical protein